VQDACLVETLTFAAAPVVIACVVPSVGETSTVRQKLSKYQRMMRVECKHHWQSFDQLLDVVRRRPSLMHFYPIFIQLSNRRPHTPAPRFTSALVDNFELHFFRSVIKLVQALPDKQCSSDPLPPWLLKTIECHCSGAVYGFSVAFPFSLQKWTVSSMMKSAFTALRYSRSTYVYSIGWFEIFYWPISNLLC